MLKGRGELVGGVRRGLAGGSVRGSREGGGGARGGVTLDGALVAAMCGACVVVVADAWWEGESMLRRQSPAAERAYIGPGGLGNIALVIDGAKLARDGYLVVDNVLTAAQTAGAARGVDQFVARSAVSRFGAPNNDGSVRSDAVAFLSDQDRSFSRCVDTDTGTATGTSDDSNECDDRALELAQAVLLGVGAAVQDSAGFRGFLASSTTTTTSSSTTTSSRPSPANGPASTGTSATWLGVPEQVQLSIYAPCGSFYTAHRDCAPDSTLWAVGLLAWLRGRAYRRRYITAILYLNDEGGVEGCSGSSGSGNSGSGTGEGGAWLPSDGGCLRLHLRPAQTDGLRVDDSVDSHDSARKGEGEEEEEGQVVGTGTHATHAIHTAHSRRLDIQPCGGRLVLLDSRTILHEVLPTRRRRVALSTFMTLNRA